MIQIHFFLRCTNSDYASIFVTFVDHKNSAYHVRFAHMILQASRSHIKTVASKNSLHKHQSDHVNRVILSLSNFVSKKIAKPKEKFHGHRLHLYLSEVDIYYIQIFFFPIEFWFIHPQRLCLACICLSQPHAKSLMSS